MKTSKNTFFIIGIIAGTASFASCLAGMETLQAFAALVCVAGFAVSNKDSKKDGIVEN